MADEPPRKDFGQLRETLRKTKVNVVNLIPDRILVGEEAKQLTDDRQSIEIRTLRHEFDELKREAGRRSQVHWTRIVVLAALFTLICIWLYFIGNVLWECAVFPEGLERDPFQLPDSVAIALITSTTVNVLGLFVLAARWLYPSENYRTTRSGAETEQN